MLNILFTSAGRRTYLINWFRQALESEGIEGKVFIANSDPLAPTMYMSGEKVVSPRIDDANYIPFIIDFCNHNNIKAIIIKCLFYVQIFNFS